MSVSVPSFLAFDPAAGGSDIFGGGTVANSAGTYYSKPSVLSSTSCSYVFSSAGTMDGTLTVQVSNGTDDEEAAGVPGTDVAKWVTYTPSEAVTVHNTMDQGIELKRLGFRRVRLKFVRSGGSGTITARFTAKD